jgi:deazaflavin-dependent oxidoreductase (nitroreductase family)
MAGCSDRFGYPRVMSVREVVTDLGFKVLNRVHRTIVHLSRGRVGRRAFGMPIVELRTIGRRSGLVRSTMLTVPVVDGDRFVLVASKGGDDRDPDWYRNLVSTPDIELVVAGEHRAMRARVATHVEAADLWPRVIASYGPYAGYRRRTQRDIPLVICEPRTSPG